MKIKKQVLKLCVVALCLFSFAACEWDGSDETHFVEVEKPEQEVANPWMELISDDGMNINPEEVIQIMNHSHVGLVIMPKTVKSYSMIDYQMGNLAAYWGGEKVNSGWSWSSLYGSSFDFRVPESLVNGEVKEMKFELDVVRTLKRSPSSLYDKLSFHYFISNTYNLRVIKEADATIKYIEETVDENGFLKLQWGKLDLNVEKILVYRYNKQLVGEVADLAKPYIVDRDYIGGYQYYYIEVHLKNTLGRRQITTEKSVSHPILSSDDVSVTENGGKVKFAWQNPNSFPTKHALVLGNKIYEIPSGQNSIEIDRAEVGDINYLKLYSVEADREDGDYMLSPDYVYVYFYLDNNLE